MKRFLLISLCFLSTAAFGSHIVGGEFEMTYIGSSKYRISLIIYFDLLNGNPGAQDPSVNARIFRMKDNVVMATLLMPLISQENVGYTQPECSSGEIVTRKLIYSTTVILSSNAYVDEMGYYIAWERCCRNYTITNIMSQDPNSGGQYAGQTFYLEFPAVVKDNQPFINSSPRLFPPLNDYACVNRPYYVDFAGIDDDGDSLVYSIVEPLNTKSGDALPLPDLLPRPRPYPNVVWRSPYGINNVLGGSPDLRISNEGFLTVTPKLTGLFVFAVKCVEYRDGKRIGEVRRDFQMLVVDCKDASPPVVSAKTLDGSYTTNSLNVAFSNSTTDQQRCIKVKVTDPDAFRVADQEQEEIHIRAFLKGFREDFDEILPSITSATLTPANPSAEFEVCFDQCPLKTGPYQIAIVTYDDACALPMTDTVNITVTVQAPPNAPPQFTTADIIKDLYEGETQQWDIKAVDADGDDLLVTVDIEDEVVLAEHGILYAPEPLTPGLFQAKLTWEALCDVYNFRDRQDFGLKIKVEDLDVCMNENPDSTIVNLHVVLPYSNPPVIETSLTAEQENTVIEKSIFETLDFNVTGTDSDPQTLNLEMFTVGFDAATHGANFTNAAAMYTVASPFTWELSCDKIDLEEKEDFAFLFVVRDEVDKCGIYRADSVTINVHVNPPSNTPPDLKLVKLSDDILFLEDQLQMRMGQTLALNLIGTDHDSNPLDEIRVELVDVVGTGEAKGYQFTAAVGTGSVTAPFTWAPDCGIFSKRDYDNEYTFRFRAVDERCEMSVADTLELNLRIKDIDSEAVEFLPPNFITPNNDGCNDFFGLEEIEEGTSCGEMNTPKLPKDNCVGRFSSIRIYNRWGKEVFQSDQRNFKWHANEEAGGVYFYTLFYTNTEYKGSITVRD
jgi:hypothetical protein